LNGVAAGGTYGGPVDLSVSFNPLYGTYGARQVVYEVLDSGANVVKSYPPIQTPPNNGGYTDTPPTFNFAWDTYDVPNGTYTIRATLYDALSVAHGGPRSNSVTVDNVTIANQPRAIRYIATTGADAGDCTNSGAPCATIDYAASQAQN